MEDKMSRIIIETETGEQLGELRQGDRVLKKESIDFLKARDETTQEWKIEHFYKGNIKEISKWLKELSITEKAFLFCIVPYISYEDCHLCYHNNRDIGTEDLVEITGLSRSVVYETINSLTKKDILYKGKNSKNRQYFMNPWLFCMGNRINKVLRTMFKNYRIRVLNNVKWGDLK